jgi:hypothetical protein
LPPSTSALDPPLSSGRRCASCRFPERAIGVRADVVIRAAGARQTERWRDTIDAARSAYLWSVGSASVRSVLRRLICNNGAEISRRGGLAVGLPSSARRWRPDCINLKPTTPESKGIVERRNVFFETSFVPGRTFLVVSITGGGDLCAAEPP